MVYDNKPRQISVATVQDRVVHRLLYDYLVSIWDKTFIYDAWSCRKGKGVHGAIDRGQTFMRVYPDAWVWRADIKKLFDTINQATTKQLLRRRVHDPKALRLLDEVIDSYDSLPSKQGLPIGNLTSQIMANIYLNEFDRLMKYRLKPLAYLRYGDDWLCFAEDRAALEHFRKQATTFLNDELFLTVNPKIDHIKPVSEGVSYLGVNMWSHGRRLQPRVSVRIGQRLNESNVASYTALVSAHQKRKRLRELKWQLPS